MLIYALFVSLSSLFQSPENVLVNKKMHGYWLVTKEFETAALKTPEGMVKVLYIPKCDKQSRQAKDCGYFVYFVDEGEVSQKNKIKKSVLKSLSPIHEDSFWVLPGDKNKVFNIISQGKETMEFNLLKGEVAVFNNETGKLIGNAKKL